MKRFRIIRGSNGSTNCYARTGVIRIGKEFSLDTPNIISPTSRGSIPHLTPDVLREHTSISGVHVALEDFLERIPKDTPPIYDFPGPLRDFICLPQDRFLILASRRCPPVDAPPKNSDSQISILTAVGFRDLPVVDYVSAAKRIQPDIVLGMADIPTILPPGKNRLPRMLFRAELWLGELLNRFEKPVDQGNTEIFAPVLPISPEVQSGYFSYLESVAERLSGLAVYDATVAPAMPQKLRELPILSVDIADGPHGLLREIAWGVDLCNVGFVIAATDAGIALNFRFGEGGQPEKPTDLLSAEQNEPKLAAAEGILHGEPLGMNMWQSVSVIDTRPLVEDCSCFTCKTYHRAYIHHCLCSKEMTAWVLLQIIQEGAFEAARTAFERRYQSELPEKTGTGPRLRGYQFKTVGGDAKKNQPPFRKLNDSESDQIETPPTDAQNLVVQ